MSTNRRVFLKQVGFGAAGLSFISSFPALGNTTRSSSLSRSTPEQQGISSSGILQFLDEVEKSKIGFHSIMIIRHGHVIAEGWWSPYAPAYKHTLYSLSKSFTSTAVGFAVAEGKLKVDDKVISFFPELVPASISDNLAAMRVKDLLTMSTGQEKEPDVRKTADWIKGFLAAPVEHVPGSRFHYNSIATFMCSAIVQKLTGQTVIEYLKPRLFDPLGIEGMDWEVNPQGINVGGWGLRLKTEDIAKFGLLYLQKGMWEGKQIIPAVWVEEATSKQVSSNPSSSTYSADNDWAQGYGYQFWRCSVGGYRGDGAFGQFCIVLPEHDLVIAATSESFDMGTSMKLIWKNILPAIKQSSLPTDTATENKMKTALKSLTLNPTKGNAISATAQRISGKKFVTDTNELGIKTISFSIDKNTCEMNVVDEKGERQLVCGLNKWIEKKNDKNVIMFRPKDQPAIQTPVASTAAWKDDNTLIITQRFTETAHGDQLTFTFEGEKLSIKFLNSVAMGNPNNPDKRTDITAHIVV